MLKYRHENIFSKGDVHSMKFKQKLAFLLIFAIAVVPLFVTGCVNGPNDDIHTIENASELPPSFNGEQKNLNGLRFTVLTKQDRSATQAFNVVDLVVEDNLGDSAIVAAVSERNTRLQTNFNVTIERITNTDPNTEASNAIMRRDDSYSAFMLTVQQSLNLALNGALVDFYNDVDYIDLEADWWDSAIISNLLLYDGAYLALGDINTVDDDCTWLVLFNKNLYTEETGNLPTVLYDVVKSGDNQVGGWTLEYLQNLASTYYRPDPNNANKYDPDYAGTGTYSVYLQDEVATVLLQASGNTPTVLDDRSAAGIRDNISGNDAFFSAFETVYNFMGGSDKGQWLLNMNDVTASTSGEDIWETIARGTFKADRTMFYICHAGTINLVRDMDSEFGILPIPKLSDQQMNYGNTIQYNNASCYVVPSRSYSDPEADDNAAYVLEAMAYMSSSEYANAVSPDNDISLKYAYRETVLKRKATRDDESMEMLDLIFDNRIFDLACALDINGINGVIMTNATSTSSHNFASSYESLPDMETELIKLFENLSRR